MLRSAASLIIAAPIPTELLCTNQGSNYRILMVKRNTKSSFINAHVYPGGVVDPADTQWSSNEPYTTEKICAIRETFEETGLLISSPPMNSLDMKTWRDRIHQDGNQFKRFCDHYALQPAMARLKPFAHWITPTFEKKRYNTTFFLTVLEQYATLEEQKQTLNHVMADGTENVLFEWLKPEEALERYNENKIVLIPPQWYSLSLMTKTPDYRQLGRVGLDIFKTRQNTLIPILPQASPSDLNQFKGCMTYPGDELHENGRKGMRHRLYYNGLPMRDYQLDINIAKL
ncbi:hypothetical protein BY458DRAFT_555073 [Sporodiniella umbellata]|nr:hypothetical protein BY458DRAFT_555073 [Sporodiniella umbellata]